MDKKDIVNLLISIFKPSLAKALSLSLLMPGIGILNSPVWLDTVNWFLANQDFYPQFKGSISAPKESTGWILISLSIFVFLVDSWKLVKANRFENANVILDTINEQPRKTADLVVEGIKEISFSAPHIVDEKINRLITELKNLRFFGSFSTAEKAIILANKIVDGELTGGSPTVKALGLALSARYLSLGDNTARAKSYLEQSKKIAHVPEANIAEAFIVATESTIAEAISMLANEDTATNYSAIFMLKRAIEDSERALNWLDSAELTVLSLDVDGQVSYISTLLSMQNWETALDVVYSLKDETLKSSPALLQLAAFTFLTNAIKAVELRESVMQQIPFAAEQFPLADDTESIKLRSKAIELFKLCSKLVSDLGCSEVSDMSSNYALWLELRNPDTHENARKELQNYFSDYSIKSLEHLPLAFAFGIELDYEKIEKEVNRQAALCNDTNPVLGIARFVLAQNQNGFPKVVEYINIHREQLEKFVNRTAVYMLEIEALAKAGLSADAEILLSKLENANIASEEIINLKNIIASVKGGDSIALAIDQYQETEKTSDLAQLVNLLERSQLKDKYLSYASELFSRTGTEVDALRMANASSALGKLSELHQFLEENSDLVKRSEPLQLHWAWSLFKKGDLISAREQLLKLKNGKSKHLDFQTLDIHLAIYSGNWDALTVLVESNWENRNELDAEQLLQAAQLAKAQSPGRAKEILEYATSQYPDNPQVLASAYFTATSMGWEDNQNTADWLNKAAMLSNEEGPLHRASFDELKDMLAAQREQNDIIYKAYHDGTAPISTVADLLNRTLSDFYLVQPLENLRATDIRRKILIAAFHSARQERVIEGNVISIDASSTLVLGFLGLLDLFFESFDQIFVSHSLMRWLYEEKQKIAFHQPSQVSKAKEFEYLVSDDFINIIEPRGIDNPELALNLGDELAFLLEEARKTSSVDNQVLVVCSYPVYRIGSFRDQEIDLSTYKNNLSSCLSLIKKLLDVAAITEDEFRQASQYLSLHHKEWPNKLDIDDQATIFLDSLSVTYLMTVGVLDKFKGTNLNIFVHSNELANYKRLRSFDSSICEADLMIEQIRNKFREGIHSGKVVLSEMQISTLEKENARNRGVQSTEELFQAITKSYAALIDDRFMNQHANISIDNKNTPIYTSLDFIETLCANGTITQEQKFTYRAKLRESGFGLVPITTAELNHHLIKSQIIEGVVRPTKELKLLKENLSLLKISRLVKLPRDAQWLHGTIRNLSRTLKQQWADDVPIELCRARSNWLYELLDFRGWANCLEFRNEDGIAYFGETIRANSLLVAPDNLSGEMKNEYNRWLDDCVLLPLKNYDPVSFKALIESVKGHVTHISEQDLLEGDTLNNSNPDHSYLVSHLLNLFPVSLRKEVISDTKFNQRHGITTDAQVTCGSSNTSFSRSTLFYAIRLAFSSDEHKSTLKDENDDDWTVVIMQDDNAVVCIERQEVKLRINTFWPLTNDIEQRISIFQEEAERRNLFEDEIDSWISVLSSKQLEDDEVGDLIADLELTPFHIEELLRFELREGNNKVTTLVPNNIHYYERLIGKHSSSCNINEYCDNELRQYFAKRVNKGISDLDLLMCSQQSISQIVAECISNDEQFLSLANEAIKSKNPISIISCIEIGSLKFLKSCNSILQNLFECLTSPEVMKRLNLLCSMTIFIDGELARLKLFEKKPPFYRRLASLTQASLVVKLAAEQAVEFENIERWAAEQRGLLFYCQTFIDLRKEPRWLPSLLTPEQFRDELYGRVYNACQKIQDSEFSTLVLQKLSDLSLIHLNAFLPGPLEGNTEPPEIPDYISNSLDEGMNEQASLEAFTTLINSAQFWKVDEKYIDLAVSLLENAQHQLKETDDKQSIYQTLNGLAKVASLVRSKKLAASVMILSRIYRDYLNVNSEPENIMAVGLVAGAAYESKDEWAEYIGQWLNELAYLPLDERAVSSLISMLDQLCVLEPYLYYTCGRPLEILRFLDRG